MQRLYFRFVFQRTNCLKKIDYQNQMAIIAQNLFNWSKLPFCQIFFLFSLQNVRTYIRFSWIHLGNSWPIFYLAKNDKTACQFSMFKNWKFFSAKRKSAQVLKLDIINLIGVDSGRWELEFSCSNHICQNLVSQKCNNFPMCL